MSLPQRIRLEPIAPVSAAKKASGFGCIAIVLLIPVIEMVYLLHPPAHKTVKVRKIPAEDQAYFDALGPPINDSGLSMDALLDAYDAVKANPAALQTPAWQAKVRAACAALDLQGKKMDGVASVPIDCRKTHKDAILTGQQMRLVAAAFAKGANPQQPDMRLLTQSVENIDAITKLSQTLADDSNEIRVKYGVASTEPDRVKAGK